MTCAELPRSLAVTTALAGLLFYAPPARAQSPEAEVLFREGRKLIKAGKLAEGCAKLEASERLESSVGALLNLGDCHEKLGKLASAWAAFRKAEGAAKHVAGDDRRRPEARRRAALLEPRLSYLVVQIEARVDGLTVRKNGEPMDPALWNTPVPLDPGVYDLVVEAPAHKPWHSVAVIEPQGSQGGGGSHDRIDATTKRRVIAVPPLEEMPVAEPAPLPAVVRASEARPHHAASMWSTKRKVAAAFAVAGAAAFGAGAYYGWRSRDLADRSDAVCPQIECGDAEALRLNDRARGAALRANLLYAAGGATAATAAILWLVGRPGETKLSPGAAGGLGVSLSGSF